MEVLFKPYKEGISEDFLLYIDGKHVGEVGLDDMFNKRRKSVYIHTLEIYYYHRGKGYSKILMEEIEKFARSMNKTKLRLGVEEDNPIAVKLYKSFGFTIKEKITDIDDTDDEFFIMTKKLT
jgi:ribosomal protein S18 acetylase RimI-like enzyme